jgi:hypothetical protein
MAACLQRRQILLLIAAGRVYAVVPQLWDRSVTPQLPGDFYPLDSTVSPFEPPFTLAKINLVRIKSPEYVKCLGFWFQ